MTISWRAVVQCDPGDFQRDRVRILLAEDSAAGRRMVLPVKLERGAPTSATAYEGPVPDPFLILPEEAAAALFNALALHFIGTNDVERLRRELVAERARVDALIAGLGRVGGVQS